MHPVIKTKKIYFFLLVSNEIEPDVDTKPQSFKATYVQDSM